MKTAIILGATGLTGNLLLSQLIDDERYGQIKIFVRHTTGLKHPKITEYLMDVLKLEQYSAEFTADEVYCCIGTTKAKTPDETLYRAIDYGIPVQAAKLAKLNQIPFFAVISSMGADPKSRIFYSRTKGEMENEVLAQNIPRTYLLRPSIILGQRKNDNRTGESITIKIFKLLEKMMVGKLKNYRPIHAETIVRGMIYLANHPQNRSLVLSSDIKKMGELELNEKLTHK